MVILLLVSVASSLSFMWGEREQKKSFQWRLRANMSLEVTWLLSRNTFWFHLLTRHKGIQNDKWLRHSQKWVRVWSTALPVLLVFYSPHPPLWAGSPTPTPALISHVYLYRNTDRNSNCATWIKLKLNLAFSISGTELGLLNSWTWYIAIKVNSKACLWVYRTWLVMTSYR